MRRIFTFFWVKRGEAAPQVWSLSEPQRVELLNLLGDLGLRIIADARGPVPLLTFGRRVLEKLEANRPGLIPLPDFADALKRVIREMKHEKLRVMSPTDFIGVGYVFNAQDPETWPVKTSR